MHVDACAGVHKNTQCTSPHYVIFAPLSKESPGKSILVGDVRATLAQIRDLDTPGSPSAAPTLTPFHHGLATFHLWRRCSQSARQARSQAPRVSRKRIAREIYPQPDNNANAAPGCTSGGRVKGRGGGSPLCEFISRRTICASMEELQAASRGRGRDVDRSR